MDYAELIGPVVKILRGEPNRAISSARELRYGTHGSLSVDLDKGTWFDHELNEGGGCIDLILHEVPEARENGGVAHWLAEQGLEGPETQNIVAPARSRGTTSSVRYEYQDASGAVSYIVERIERGGGKKTFRQKRIENGREVYGLGGLDPLPYGLPDMLAQPDAPVFIVEGEKCVEAARSIGLVASTNSGGAGNWGENLNQYFKGRRIVILPDADDAGRRHGNKVAQQLQGVAQAIKSLELPGAHDIYDWIAAGNTKADLVALVKAAPELERVPVQARFKVMSLWDLAALPEPEFLIEDIFIEGTDAVLYGPSESHKSGTAISWAVAVAHGEQWMGHKVKQGPVLFIAGEGGALLFKRINATLKRAELEWTQDIQIISDNVDAFSNEAEIEDLIALAEDMQPRLIVWDTISQHSGAATENNDEMKNVLRNMRRVARACGAANLIIAHPGKDADRGVRGWSGQKNNIDALFSQRCNDPYITLSCEKQKDAAHFEPVHLRYEIHEDAPVIVEGTASPFGEGAQKLTSKNNRRAYRALCNILSRRDFIDGDPHCTEKEWRDECARIGLGGTDNADSQAKAFRRAYANLIDTHFYTNGQKVYLADKTGLSGGEL